jgi:2-polyprenyl-6-methoxyphenol hydroxylase-like FAD-dependent oxidoreductase
VTRRAVVAGAGVAGLCAARVLADHFDQVVLVDRDRLADSPAPRSGVPQSRHVHILLMRGLYEVESLFPGFTAELDASGAVPVDLALDMKTHSLFGWFPRYRSDLVQRFCSRGLIEQILRRRVLALPRIQLLDAHEIEGLVFDGGAVRGVTCRPRPASDTKEVTTIEALLVVDATGRNARVLGLLKDAGLAESPFTEVDAFMGYASRIVRPPREAPDWRALLVRNPLPSSRGGVITPLEDGRWIVTLAGFGRDYPPVDEAGFAAFADSLVETEFNDALHASEPLSPIAGYRQTCNRRRHLERLVRWPAGFAALGDAVCAFNPAYGQGMSVAATGAAVLRDLLAERAWRPDMGSMLHRRVTATLATPWRLATSEDYRFPMTVGPARGRVLRALHWYGDQVIRAAVHSPDVHNKWLRVVNLLEDPASLLTPGVFGRAILTRG